MDNLVIPCGCSLLDASSSFELFPHDIWVAIEMGVCACMMKQLHIILTSSIRQLWGISLLRMNLVIDPSVHIHVKMIPEFTTFKLQLLLWLPPVFCYPF